MPGRVGSGGPSRCSGVEVSAGAAPAIELPAQWLESVVYVLGPSAERPLQTSADERLWRALRHEVGLQQPGAALTDYTLHRVNAGVLIHLQRTAAGRPRGLRGSSGVVLTF